MSNCHNLSNSKYNCILKPTCNNYQIPETLPAKYYGKFNVNFYPTSALDSVLTLELTEDFGSNNLIKLGDDKRTITLASGYIYSISYVFICCSFKKIDDNNVPVASYVQIYPNLTNVSLGETLASSQSYGAILSDDSGYNGNLTCSASFITNAASTNSSLLTFTATAEATDLPLSKVDFNGTISIYPIAKL